MYLHSIEYHRRGPGGKLTLEQTETVEDHGWYIKKGDEWKAEYTLGCAVDFLARVGAKAGVFAVVVWREDTRVCAVGVDWKPSAG